MLPPNRYRTRHGQSQVCTCVFPCSACPNTRYTLHSENSSSCGFDKFRICHSGTASSRHPRSVYIWGRNILITWFHNSGMPGFHSYQSPCKFKENLLIFFSLKLPNKCYSVTDTSLEIMAKRERGGKSGIGTALQLFSKLCTPLSKRTCTAATTGSPDVMTSSGPG